MVEFRRSIASPGQLFHPTPSKDSFGYEPIASEYYSARHITSRNFDAATLFFLRGFHIFIPRKGLVLDLGAGRGNVGRYCGVEGSRILQIDISPTMLSTRPREECFQAIRCDALCLPLLDSTISAAAAFLYDSFNTSRLYHEVHRVLRAGGVFVGTLPHYDWGEGLRRIIGYPPTKTKFLTDSGAYVEFDSFLMTDTQIKEGLAQSGLTLVSTHDLYLPDEEKDVSPHVRIAASALGVDVYSTPIVKLVVAEK